MKYLCTEYGVECVGIDAEAMGVLGSRTGQKQRRQKLFGITKLRVYNCFCYRGRSTRLFCPPTHDIYYYFYPTPCRDQCRRICGSFAAKILWAGTLKMCMGRTWAS